MLGALVLIAVGLVARAVDLQLLDEGFLEGQGDARFTRVAKLSANRGGIYDRNGEPLAASTPVDTVWACPPEVMSAADQIPRLAEALNRDKKWLTQVITSNLDREFVYLVRHMRPSDAAQVAELKIPGVYLLREYQRFYPAGEVTGHLLGFTKKYDDIGQEGLELAYDRWLGARGRAPSASFRIATAAPSKTSRASARRVPASDLITSIDLRIQYLAYRELKAAVQEHRAKARLGRRARHRDRRSARDGESAGVQPERSRSGRGVALSQSRRDRHLRAGLEHQAVHRRRRHRVRSLSRRTRSSTPRRASCASASRTFPTSTTSAPISLTTVLAKSSNVGMTKMAMTLSPRVDATRRLRAFGFGEVTGSGFPGESAGLLNDSSHWRKIGQATISYGYGLSVTPLQLARAYATLGAGGINRPVTLRRVDEPVPGERVHR